MKILFVCTGNICRSPTAEAMFRAQVQATGLEQRILCDSAGTHGYHTGETPDPRTMAAAKKRGVDMNHLRARRVLPQDYDLFDLILAMDSSHLRSLKQNQPPNSRAEVAMYLAYAGVEHTADVPDPYYEGAAIFEQVLDLTAEASEKLLAIIRMRVGG